MRPILKIVITLYVTFFFLQVHSQDSTADYNGHLNGRIINEETHNHISLVHIYNERTRKTIVSDTSGNFIIKVEKGDSLVFSSVGYFLKVTYVTESLLKNPRVIVRLTPRKYEVPEAKVFALSTYEQFKQKLLLLKLPKTRTDKLRENLQKIARQVAQEEEYRRQMDAQTEGVILAAIPILSPEEIQMIRLNEILIEEEIQKTITEKYSREIVGKITGLEDKELTEFLIFCNFSDEYLLQTNQYDILIRVLEKLNEFKILKYGGFNIYNQELKLT